MTLEIATLELEHCPISHKIDTIEQKLSKLSMNYLHWGKNTNRDNRT